MKTITYIFAAIGLVTVLRSSIVRTGLVCASEFLAASMVVPVEVEKERAELTASVATPSQMQMPKSITLELPIESEPKAAQADPVLPQAEASVDESETGVADAQEGQGDGAAETISVLRMYDRAENSMKSSED